MRCGQRQHGLKQVFKLKGSEHCEVVRIPVERPSRARDEALSIAAQDGFGIDRHRMMFCRNASELIVDSRACLGVGRHRDPDILTGIGHIPPNHRARKIARCVDARVGQIDHQDDVASEHGRMGEQAVKAAGEDCRVFPKRARRARRIGEEDLGLAVVEFATGEPQGGKRPASGEHDSGDIVPLDDGEHVPVELRASRAAHALYVEQRHARGLVGDPTRDAGFLGRRLKGRREGGCMRIAPEKKTRSGNLCVAKMAPRCLLNLFRCPAWIQILVAPIMTVGVSEGRWWEPAWDTI